MFIVILIAAAIILFGAAAAIQTFRLARRTARHGRLD